MIQSRRGAKLYYALIISLSTVLLLVCLLTIIGLWVGGRAIANSTVAIFGVVEESTLPVRRSMERVDQTLERLGETTNDIATSAREAGDTIDDQGLVRLLLPEEKEAELAERAAAVQAAYEGIRESLESAIALYRTLGRLPFLDLPRLNDERVVQLESQLAETQRLAADLRSDVLAVRSGAAGAAGRIESSATLLATRLEGAQEVVAQVDTELGILERNAITIQRVIPGLTTRVSIFFTIVLALLMITQIEVLRLYVGRWGTRERSPPPKGLTHEASLADDDTIEDNHLPQNDDPIHLQEQETHPMSKQERSKIYNVIAFVFDGRVAANQAVRQIKKSGALKGQLILAEVVVERDENGKVSVHQPGHGTLGTVLGGVGTGLLSLIGGPAGLLMWTVGGAVVGGVAGKYLGRPFKQGDVERIGQALELNSSAFLLLVEDIYSQVVLDKMEHVSAEVITLTVGDELSQQIMHYELSSVRDDQGNEFTSEGFVAADGEGNITAGGSLYGSTDESGEPDSLEIESDEEGEDEV